jgi:hypothetical protein
MRGTKATRPLAVAAVICGALAAMFGGAGAAVASPGADLRGTVVNQSVPIEGVEVCATPTAGEGIDPGCVITGQNGTPGGYEFLDLAPGTYRFEYRPDPLSNYLPAIFDSVPVAAGESTESQVPLRRGAEFEGKVTEAGTGAPIETFSGVQICALDPNTQARIKCVSPDSGGNYVLPGLPTGAYVIAFAEDRLVLDQDPYPDGYVRQYWEGAAEFDEALWMLIEAGAVASGIDAELTPGAETFPPAEDPGGSSNEEEHQVPLEEDQGGGFSEFPSLPNWPGAAPLPQFAAGLPGQPQHVVGKSGCTVGHHWVTKEGQSRCAKIQKKKPRRHRHHKRHRRHR